MPLPAYLGDMGSRLRLAARAEPDLPDYCRYQNVTPGPGPHNVTCIGDKCYRSDLCNLNGFDFTHFRNNSRTCWVCSDWPTNVTAAAAPLNASFTTTTLPTFAATVSSTVTVRLFVSPTFTVTATPTRPAVAMATIVRRSTPNCMTTKCAAMDPDRWTSRLVLAALGSILLLLLGLGTYSWFKRALRNRRARARHDRHRNGDVGSLGEKATTSPADDPARAEPGAPKPAPTAGPEPAAKPLRPIPEGGATDGALDTPPAALQAKSSEGAAQAKSREGSAQSRPGGGDQGAQEGRRSGSLL